MLADIPHRAADDAERTPGSASSSAPPDAWAASCETHGLRELLQDSLEHPRWDEVAERCLTCGNCTMVCPTCFCTTVEDVTDLTGEQAERWRAWDTCFSLDHSYVHGGSVRPTGRSRYRQWMTHKLGTWWDQFGTSGCVGCGRCIAWCPVGIDITEEAAALRASPDGRWLEGLTPSSSRRRSSRGSMPPTPRSSLGARDRGWEPGRDAVPRGRPGRRVLRRPSRPRGARALRPEPWRADRRDDRARRGRRLVVALSALPLALRRSRGRAGPRGRRRRRLSARESARTIQRSATS